MVVQHCPVARGLVTDRESHMLGGCPRIRFHVISTEGRNLKLTYFQYNKISRYARNDNFGELSDSLLVIRF